MKVAVAVIMDSQQRILITQRPLHVSQGGLWEFPGGKLEAGETGLTALIREIKEEVNLEIEHADFLGEISHTYVQHAVTLLVYCVTAFQGHAYPREAQINLRWVERQSLHQFEFPEANQQILALLNTALL